MKNVKMGKKGGLAVRLFSIAVLPVIIMGILLSLAGTSFITGGVNEETKENLKNSVVYFEEILNSIDDGDINNDTQGNVFKGETEIREFQQIMTDTNKATGVDVTIFYGKTRVLTTVKDENGDFIVGTDAAGEVVTEVLDKGNEFFSTNVLVNGVPYYGYYMPIHNQDGSVAGMIFAGKPTQETKAYIFQSVIKFIIIAVALLAVTIILSIISVKSIVRSAKVAEDAAEKIAEGILSQKTDQRILKRKDEMGDIGRSVELIRNSLRDTVGLLVENANTISQFTEKQDVLISNVNRNASEVSKAVEGVSEGAMSQAEEVQTASENVNIIGGLIEEISESLNSLENTAGEMQKAGTESVYIINELDDSNEKTVSAVEKIAGQINATYRSAEQIKEAINIISNIAEETNLLSLNASIEAARAGEQGRGFAVVAGEIQKLAEQSNQSSNRIRTVIEALVSDAEKTVEIMEDVKETVAQQHEKLEETKIKFEKVSTGISSSLEEIEGIHNNSRALSKSRETIIEVIENLSAISQENAASAQETSASVQELSENITTVAAESWNLNEMSAELEETAKKFTL